MTLVTDYGPINRGVPKGLPAKYNFKLYCDRDSRLSRINFVRLPVNFLPQGVCVEYECEAGQREVHHAAHSAVERAETLDGNHLEGAINGPRVWAD